MIYSAHAKSFVLPHSLFSSPRNLNLLYWIDIEEFSFKTKKNTYTIISLIPNRYWRIFLPPSPKKTSKVSNPRGELKAENRIDKRLVVTHHCLLWLCKSPELSIVLLIWASSPVQCFLLPSPIYSYLHLALITSHLNSCKPPNQLLHSTLALHYGIFFP